MRGWTNRPNHGNRIDSEMIQKFEEASHPIFVVLNFFRKEISSPTKGEQTIHFQSTTQTQTIVIRTVLACSQFVRLTPSCVIGLISTIGTMNLIVVEVRNVQQKTSLLTHRQDLTASGNRLRDDEDSKTIARVSQEGGFTAEVGKGQYFCDPTLSQWRRQNGHLSCREQTPTSRKSRFKNSGCFVW